MEGTAPARTLVVRFATALAAVALPLGLLSGWVSAYVGDTDRYVETVRPLAHDEAVKAAAIDYLDRAAATALDSGDQIGTFVRGLDLSCLGVDAQALGGFADLVNGFIGPGTPLGDQVRQQVRPLIDDAVHRAVVRAVEQPTFESAWVAANREAHQQVLAALEGRERTAGPDRILIPLTEVSRSFTEGLGCEGLIPADLAPSFTLVTVSDVEGLGTGYRVLDALGFSMPLVFALGLVVALVLATDRRRVLVGLAAGVLAGLAVVALVLLLVKGAISSEEVSSEVLDAVWGALTHGLTWAMVGLAAVAAASLGVLWVTRRAPAAEESVETR